MQRALCMQLLLTCWQTGDCSKHKHHDSICMILSSLAALFPACLVRHCFIKGLSVYSKLNLYWDPSSSRLLDVHCENILYQIL